MSVVSDITVLAPGVQLETHRHQETQVSLALVVERIEPTVVTVRVGENVRMLKVGDRLRLVVDIPELGDVT